METWEKDFLNKSINITQTIKCLDSYGSYKEFKDNYKEFDLTFIHIMEGLVNGKNWEETQVKEINSLKQDIGTLAINYLYDNI